MANAAEHSLYGGLAGGIAYLVMCQYLDRQADLGELVACAGAGLLAAAIPDFIEPATHPGHRGFVHSISLGGVILRAGLQNCHLHNQTLTQSQKLLIASVIAGFLSHLIADACTPKCLPVF